MMMITVKYSSFLIILLSSLVWSLTGAQSNFAPTKSFYNKTECQAGDHAVPPTNDQDSPKAPEVFEVHWKTTASDDVVIVLQVLRRWSPKGADRFYQLVLDNFYNCAGFFRVVQDFVVQFGLADQPDETKKWVDLPILDDRANVQSNVKGTVSFATAGKDTRTTQIFVNMDDNAFLDKQVFTPFGQITKGMDLLAKLYDPTPRDSGGVSQGKIEAHGNKWLLEHYPLIDIITGTTLVIPGSGEGGSHHDEDKNDKGKKKPDKGHNHDDEDVDDESTNSKGNSDTKLVSLSTAQVQVQRNRSWVAIAIVLEIGLVVLLLRR